MSSNPLNPDFIIYHHHADSNKLLFRVSSKELLYTRGSMAENFSGRILFSYRLYDADNSKLLTDSNTVLIQDRVSEKFSHDILGELVLKTSTEKTQKVILRLEDLNRKAHVEALLYINKIQPYNSQYFLVKNQKGNIIFRSYTNRADTLTIESKTGDAPRFFVKVFEEDFPFPPPPFSAVRTTAVGKHPERIKVLHPDAERRFTVQMPTIGYLVIQADTSSTLGQAVFNFGEDFPETSTPEGLISPLRYLCTKKEYDRMMESEDKKKASDKFWLSISPGKDRARILIKEYYDRIHKANAFFSSYQPGWKTDRGMVSIIMGWPTEIRRTQGVETWIYGDERQYKATIFKFVQYDNPFTSNDYRLERNEAYKHTWYRAVDAWRSGRIYTLN